MNDSWLLCPVCKNKTRIKIRGDTEIKNLPLFCPKCKHECLVAVKNLQVIVIKEPAAQTQSR
ncbi:MAG: cysteine-rich KTR domain-containing protein [Lactobacillus sp.]|nr:cysteine-rich KTR domain-containing protein [Lactobacillus sp.]